MSFEYAVAPGTTRPGRPARRRARVVAFYLPHYYPVADPSAGAGSGESGLPTGAVFNEWSTVRNAGPLYPGHAQPLQPGLLGHYDQRDPAIRQAQALLARGAGIEAFCYLHYWFGQGQRALDRPFNEVLAGAAPDFPFCLCWANEDWFGLRPGRAVKIEQTYTGATGYAAHFNALLPAFQDPRYLKIAGKPIFVVQNPENLPDPTQFTNQWRRLAAAAGLPGLHLIAIGADLEADYLIPFDARMPAGPQDFLARAARPSLATSLGSRFLSGKRAVAFAAKIRPLSWLPMRYDYAELAKSAFATLPSTARYIPCVLAGWDSTPRDGRAGLVLENFSAHLYRQAFERALAATAVKKPDDRLIFVKSWNDWSHGSYLEPDELHGTSLLETTRALTIPI
jgi:hypothetical protein